MKISNFLKNCCILFLKWVVLIWIEGMFFKGFYLWVILIIFEEMVNGSFIDILLEFWVCLKMVCLNMFFKCKIYNG